MAYELLIQFQDQSASFVHGFEAGQIWEALKARVPEIGRTIHEENVELASQMAERQGYDFNVKELDNGWVDAKFTKRN